jgi:hypothetical protein
LAWRALPAFCLTVDVSSSIDAAVSSSELACISVRADRSMLPVAIWSDAAAIVSVLARTRVTMPCRLARMLPSARLRRPVSVSSFGSTASSPARSPVAMRAVKPMASSSSMGCC